MKTIVQTPEQFCEDILDNAHYDGQREPDIWWTQQAVYIPATDVAPSKHVLHNTFAYYARSGEILTCTEELLLTGPGKSIVMKKLELLPPPLPVPAVKLVRR